MIKVSENNKRHCAGTTKIAVKVMQRNASTGKPWVDLGKWTQRVRTGHVGTDCSKYGQQQHERPNNQRWTATANNCCV